MKTIIMNTKGHEFIGLLNINQGSKFYLSLVKVPKGTAKKLIGRDLNTGEEVELKGEF